MPRVVIAALMLMLATGCRSLQSGDSEGETVQVQKGSEFDLMTGETARISGSFVSITFTRVRKDSRCPADVQCVWQGNAVVQLALRHANGPVTDTALSVNQEPRSMRYENFFVTVRNLMPARRTDHPLKQEEYTVTLRVTER
jgi:hypothetical protein